MSGSHPRDVLHRPRLRLPVTDSGYPSLSDVDEPGYSGASPLPLVSLSPPRTQRRGVDFESSESQFQYKRSLAPPVHYPFGLGVELLPQLYIPEQDSEWHGKVHSRNIVEMASRGFRSDDWHHGLPRERTVGFNHNSVPGIQFFSDDGISVGVAIGKLMYGYGMALKDDCITRHMPPELQELESGTFYIDWPGYKHLKWKAKLTFINPDRTRVTLGDLGRQIGTLFHLFYEEHYDDFEKPGIPLGPHDTTFNSLRVQSIYKRYRGDAWYLEASYVMPD